MKNRVFILSFLISMISVNFVFAQTSTKKLSYQAVVRNAANELVVNQNLAVEITVLDAENAPQYKETHPSVPTNQNGLLWLWVGEGNPTLGTMADVVWKDAVIRSVFTLPDGSTVTQNTPVTAMPYAYFADEVDTIFLQNYLDTHDVVPDNYVTHPQLNDTLDHYYTKGNVDNKLNDYEKKSELCGDVKECIKDTLGKYTTSNQIDTLLGAYYDTTHTKSVISDTATALRAMMGDAAYNSKITLKKNNVELDSFRLNQQTDKAINIPVPTTVAELSDAGNYTTNAQLNDTLSHYYTDKKINDTLSHYLTQEVQVLSVSNDTLYLTGGSWVKLPKGFSGDYNDLTNRPDLSIYATNVHLDDTLSYYFDTTQVKTAIHDTANAIRAAIPAQVNADWNATSGKAEILNKPDLSVYATNAHLNDTLNSFATKDTLSAYATKDTLKNFLTISGLCDSLVKCGVIKDMRDSIRDNAAAIQINATNIQTNATNIGLNKQAIIDSSAHIRNDIKNGQITIAVNRSTATTETTVTNPTFGVNQRTDQTVTINIPQETTVNNGQLTIVAAGDTTRFTANQATNDTVRLNKFATKDTLAAYYDTTHTKDVISDTATALRAMMVDAANDGQLTIIAAGDTTRFTANQATNDTMRLNKFATKDTLAAYYDTADVKQMLKPYLKANELCDSIVKCDVIKDMRDSLGNAFDTLKYYYTSKKINDTLKAYYDTTRVKALVHDSLDKYVLKTAVRDSITNNVNLTVKHDSLFLTHGNGIDTVPAGKMIHDSIASRVHDGKLTLIKTAGDTTKLFTANQATNDTLDLSGFYDTTHVKKAIHDSLTQNVELTIKSDSLFLKSGGDIDTVKLPAVPEQVKSDWKETNTSSAAYILNKPVIKDSVNIVVKDSLQAANSAINKAIDTIARHNISDSTRMVFDSLHLYYATKEALKDTATAIRHDICDSATTCITKALADANSDINHAIDTIARHNIHDTASALRAAIHDSLSNYKIKDCADVVNCVDNALADGTSATNHAIDTIARHNISDSTRMVFDTLHLYYTTLQTLKDTASNIRSAFPTVNNGTLTIQKNGTSVGSFTANQATPENINIDVPTKLSQMINDGGVYAKRDSINVFTAENNFTSTVTVPSNTTTIPRPTTAEHPCTDNTANAVNICDLLAVFDSLNNRIKKLEDNMALMKSTMKPTTITSSIVNSATTTNAITVQATATNSAFNILSYEFCCSDCGDGVTPVCTTITSNSYTFENLNSYTDYHFTVKAHTFIDTVESSPVQAKTKAEAPTATYVVTALPVPQAGFTVDLSEIDLKGVENGTVKVAYKKSTASNYGNESTENINASSDTYSKTVSNLEGNTSYDVRIKIDNGDAVTTYNATVTTGNAVTFAITRIFPENSSVKRCSGKVSAFFSIAPNIGEVSDYDYQWSTTGSGTSQSQVDSLYLVEYTTTGTKTVSCTATYKLNTDISFQRSVTLSIVKNTNTNVYSGYEPYYDVNIDGHTVTLTDIGGSDMFVDWVSWENNAFPVVAGNPPAHTYDEYGTYSISAYSSDGCKTTTTNVKVDPSVNVTNDHEPDNIGLCGESEVQVTYTAVPEEGEINDYSYVWSVSTGATIVSQTNNTCIVNYTSAGDYTITCNATHTPSNTLIQKITNTTINSGSKPTLVLCQEDNSLKLLSFGDATYIDWGYDFPNQSSTPHTNEVTPNYPQGSYTVTIRNNAGCSSSKEVYFGVVHSFVPCVLSEIDPSGTHPAQETAATGVDITHNNDGMETVENGAITSITDYDGNVYPVVQIGSQCWLAENMRCTHSPSTGTNIVNPQGLSGNNAKGSCSFKTAHWYNNDPSSHGGVYGLLYDWCAAVDTYYVDGGYNETDWGVNTTFHSKGWPCTFTGDRRGICPKGWHVPTDEEWNVMEAEVGGSGTDYETTTGYRGSHAGKLAKDWCRWQSSTTSNAPGYISADRNSSYFSAVNTGYYSASTFSSSWVQYTRFWSASSYDNYNAWCRELNYNKAGVYRYGLSEKTNGLSVRCVRDSE